MPHYRIRAGWPVALMAALMLPGCGSDYPVFHPAGPVARSELRIILLSTVVGVIIIFLIWTLFAIVLVRFRDIPDNPNPYRPSWRHHRWIEVGIFTLPVVALIILAIPMVRQTYILAHVPARRPLVVDATALDYKWVFQYPQQHVATVNYLDIPVGRPVLFQLTSHSPMAAFWVPNLGGMEYAMPNRVLPLWLKADRQGTYMGRNAQFDGLDFWRMTFRVQAVPKAQFSAWTRQIRASQPAMTDATWRQLAHFGVSSEQAFSSYPADTFPERPTQFTVKGLYYAPTRKL